jgi:hypothetical protein
MSGAIETPRLSSSSNDPSSRIASRVMLTKMVAVDPPPVRRTGQGQQRHGQAALQVVDQLIPGPGGCAGSTPEPGEQPAKGDPEADPGRNGDDRDDVRAERVRFHAV